MHELGFSENVPLLHTSHDVGPRCSTTLPGRQRRVLSVVECSGVTGARGAVDAVCRIDSGPSLGDVDRGGPAGGDEPALGLLQVVFPRSFGATRLGS